jgi:hypothetical protein
VFYAVNQQHAALKLQDEAVEPVRRRCCGLHSIVLRQPFQKKFTGISVGRQDNSEAIGFPPGIDPAANVGSNGRFDVQVLERCNSETTTRQGITARPSLALSWRLDAATGKPVARWTIVQAEKAASFGLRPAA